MRFLCWLQNRGKLKCPLKKNSEIQKYFDNSLSVCNMYIMLLLYVTEHKLLVVYFKIVMWNLSLLLISKQKHFNHQFWA